ncbi:MAG: hypothetical protein ACI9W4_001298 [Rhodothermales bacterium]|jgi:hypothetical protein
MPRVSVYLIRLALVHLVVGATLGTLLLIQKATPVHAGIWILPRNKETVRHHHSWAAACLLNLGVWVAAIGGGQRSDGV